MNLHSIGPKHVSRRSLVPGRPNASSGRRWRAVIVATATANVVAVGAWTTPATASPAYAYALSSGFGFGGGCPACHENQAGGLGTANKPFGETMRALGLGPNDTNSLYEALTALQPSNIDSDGDTIADFDELSPQGDPNNPDVFPEDATPVPTPAPQAMPTASSGAPSTAQPPTPVPSSAAPAAAPQPKDEDGGCQVGLGQSSATPWGLLALVLAGCRLTGRRRSVRRSSLVPPQQ